MVPPDSPMSDRAGSQQGSKTPASVRPPRSVPPRAGGPGALVGLVLSGRYKIEKVIGEGGMGAVYQAEHTLMHKRVALKVLHPEMTRMPEVVSRFEREAMAAAHIDHPNVAAATDFGKLEDGSFFLVLEYIEGKPLRDVVAQGRLEPSRALRILRQIASALSRAHSLGIVHRDLKPENVMLVDREGDPDFVKVLDFGIAKVPVGDIAPELRTTGQALTQLGMVYGTPEYMAPEQALGQEVDQRADLYSLGVMSFEMLVGKRPFDHESKVKLLGMHVTAPVPPMTDVPAEAAQIVSRLLKKEATERYQDAKELVDAIDLAFGPPASQTALRQSHRSLPEASVSAAVAPLLSQPAIARPHAHTSRYQVERPLPLPPKLLIASLAGIALFVFIAIVLVRNAAHGKQTTMSDGGLAFVQTPSATGTSKPTPADSQVDDAVKLSTAKLSSGDPDAAIAILTKIEATHADRPDVHKQLYLAYMQTSSTKEAMDEAGKWLDLDDKAQNDVKLGADIKAAALSGMDGTDGAFGILETKMGSRGPDALYDLAYGTGVGVNTQLRARKSLAKPEVQKLSSATVEVTLAIRKADSCEQKKAHFEKAREVGDQRTLVVLMSYTPKSGCGFVGTRDCWPCMRKEGSLLKTITAVQAKANAAP